MGKLLTNTLIWTHHVIGTGKSILCHTSNTFPHAPINWWTWIAEFLRDIEGELIIEDEVVVPANVVNDRSIMDDMCEFQWTTEEWKAMNLARLYMRVTYLSEIIHPQENKVLSEAWELENLSASRSLLEWPSVEKPSPQIKKIWKRVIKKLYLQEDSLNLRVKPSREWKPYPERGRQWNANVILERGNPTYVVEEAFVYKITSQTRRTIAGTPCNNKPANTNSVPVIWCDNQGSWDASSMTSATTTTAQCRKSCDIIVTDGSVLHGKGGYGGVIVTGQSEEYVYGSFPSSPGLVNSFRAEAAGAAATMFSRDMAPHRYYCDNSSLINALNKKEPLPPLSPEWDLTEPTRQYVQSNNVRCEHIKGHQDRDNTTLTDIAKFNVKADSLADQGRQSKPPQNLNKGHRITLTVAGYPVTSKYSREIRRAYHSHEVQQYYERRHHWNYNTSQSIDWAGLESAISRLPSERQTRTLKYFHNWDFRKLDDKCLCGTTASGTHILLCPLIKEARIDFTKRLQCTLKKLRTHRPLREAIMAYFDDTGNTSPRAWGQYQNQIECAIREQDRLGEDAVWRGVITQKWGDIQEQFYRDNKEKKELTGDRWTKTLITAVFEFFEIEWKKNNDKRKGNKMNPQIEEMRDTVKRLQGEKLRVPKQLKYLYTNPGIPKENNENTMKALRRWIRLFRHIKTVEISKRKHGCDGTSDIRDFFCSSGRQRASAHKRQKLAHNSGTKRRKRKKINGADIRGFFKKGKTDHGTE